MIYTGIGSRKAPKDILDIIESLGVFFARKGFTLRSGHATGCDQAFERGCNKAFGKKEVWLPWKGFEGSDSIYIGVNKESLAMAKCYHLGWDAMDVGSKKLHARNCHQVLGVDLSTPSKFLVCWTPEGHGGGGTGQAIRIAKSLNIPIFDFGAYDSIEKAKEAFNDFFRGVSTIV